MKKKITFSNIKNKILLNKEKIAVIGLGYVGLPLAVSFAKKKIKVIGLDNNKEKIARLKVSESVISTIPSKILKKVKEDILFSSNFNLIKSCDVIIICVPTPIYIRYKTPMMDHVKDVIDQISKYSIKNKLIILECTTYPGTTEEFLLPKIKKQKLIEGKNVFIGYSAEREDPGNKSFSILNRNIVKVVSGKSKNSLDLVDKIYSKITNKTYKVSNIKTAEFTKLLENIYRSVNIGMINEMKAICDKFEINIYESIEAAKSKPFGFHAFYPGPGVGGHCIPVDPYFLSWKANQLGARTRFIKLAGEINESRPTNIVDQLIDYFQNKNLSKLKCLLLGQTYKKNSDDLRMSPAVEVMKLINKKISKQIYVCDSNLPKRLPASKDYKLIDQKKINKAFLKQIDFVLILTDHDNVDYQFIEKNSKLIFDTRNVYKTHLKQNKKVILL
jgi:UDP-N-acetyl-D-glucosamine dehydrogenase